MAWAVGGGRSARTGGSGALNVPVRGAASSATTIALPSGTLVFSLSDAPQIVGFAKALLVHGGVYSITAGAAAAALNEVDGSLPAGLLVAYGGASMAASLPALALTASGTVPGIGRLATDLPALQLSAEGKGGAQAAVAMTLLTPLSIVARSGAQAALRMTGGLTAVASGLTGAICAAQLTLTDGYDTNAAATVQPFAKATMVLPALSTAPSGQAWLVTPSLSLHAVGHEVVAVAYEAYAINLKTGAVTHYLNYPFTNILRFGNDFFGVSSSGLFKIGGTLDGTQPIAAHIKTFSTKLGTSKMKRVPYIYTSGRSDGGVLIGVTPDEDVIHEYASDWGEVAGSTNHRTKVGGGVRGAYFTFDVSNINGSSLALDTLSVDPAVSQRGV